MNTRFLKTAQVALVLVYLVILAGALVRMTGSGMGCPDWPKCFGYYIPPTDIKELTWAPNRSFEKGQVIIKDEALWVATEDFTTGASYDASKFRAYTKHDYAIFNPMHTWIEYINRLCGALAGFAVLAMAVFSLRLKAGRARIASMSWLVVFLMGFQAWLGATVVYSVLNPIRITLHMVVALVIVALLLYIIAQARGKNKGLGHDSLFYRLLWASALLTLIQIVLGTQVRQFVDEQIKSLGYEQLQLVLENPKTTFYFHRSLSFLVFFVNLWIWMRNRKLQLGYRLTGYVLGVIGIEITSGIAMYYFAFPFGSQALHLMTASILFGLQFYLILQYKNQHQTIIE